MCARVENPGVSGTVIRTVVRGYEYRSLRAAGGSVATLNRRPRDIDPVTTTGSEPPAVTIAVLPVMSATPHGVSRRVTGQETS